MLDVNVRFREKDATVRYVAGKVTLDQILKQYDDTPFGVTPAGPIIAIARTKHLTLRGWTKRAELKKPTSQPKKPDDKKAKTTKEELPEPIELFVEIIPDTKIQVQPEIQLSFADPPVAELALLEDFRKVLELNTGTRRFVARLTETVELKPGELIVPVNFKIVTSAKKEEAAGKLNVALRTIPTKSTSDAASTGVTLVNGTLELTLGHLCDQKGCVEHLHNSLNEIAGLGAVFPRPNLKQPRATVFLRANQPIDVWNLHQKLRDQGVEITGIVPRELTGYRLRVELPRFIVDQQTGAAEQCVECRDHTVEKLTAASWAKNVDVSGGGINLLPSKPEVDLIEVVRAMTKIGVAPQSVWLVPTGVPMPKTNPPQPLKPRTGPKSGGSQVHPIVEFDLAHNCDVGTDIITLLDQQKWAIRTHRDSPDSTTSLAAIGDRKYANLTPILLGLRSNGQVAQQIRLREFGDIRVQLEFTHICGEVEYSKPPKPKKKKPDKEKADKEKAKDEKVTEEKEKEDTEKKEEKKKEDAKPQKPFVPKPLQPAKTSNGRKAIEAAINSVGWIKDGVFHDYHSKPEYRGGPRKITIAFQAKGEDVVRLDELIEALRKAGFPPKSVIVSRRFSGLPFAKPMPGDLELTNLEKKKQSLVSLKQPDRPLALAFVALKCKRHKKYNADPKLYADIAKTIEKYKDRVDFVAVSANSEDKFPEVVDFWKKTGLSIPLMHDADGAIGGLLNVQATPAPHMFVFDAEGRFRHAGDPHTNWEKPDEKKDDFLAKALDLVLAKKYQANGAVFFNKSLCNCSDPKCKCPKCGCGSTCRCSIKH